MIAVLSPGRGCVLQCHCLHAQHRRRGQCDRLLSRSVFSQHPFGIPCTDTRSLPAKPHEGRLERAPPIAHGLFPNYIRKFVTEERVLSLEEAVRNATWLPAQGLGLSDRGRVTVGAYADIAAFDLDKLEMRGDFAQPTPPPGGIKQVLINGQVVYENITHQEVRSGRVLRHKSGTCFMAHEGYPYRPEV